MWWLKRSEPGQSIRPDDKEYVWLVFCWGLGVMCTEFLGHGKAHLLYPKVGNHQMV